MNRKADLCTLLLVREVGFWYWLKCLGDDGWVGAAKLRSHSSQRQLVLNCHAGFRPSSDKCVQHNNSRHCTFPLGLDAHTELW